jgi:hypothetical protein
MDTKDTKLDLLRKAKDLFFVILGVLGVLGGDVALIRAQPGGFQMPDPKQMSGIPRPVDDLPNGAISVRLIRGSLSNNLTGHPVDLHVGSKVITVKTDENGRAEFKDFVTGTDGAQVKATADVDGEHLESQEFPAPTRGGIRLMLVATDTTKGPAASPEAPAITGAIVLAEQSRIVVEPGDDGIRVFYLLDIANNARVPVNPPAPFVFDVPSDATGTTLMEGSSPAATVKGNRVTVQGPFPPGHTYVQVGQLLPLGDGEVRIAQAFPAPLEQLAVVVKKTGATVLASPDVAQQRDIPAEGEVFIAGTGGAIAAGKPIDLTISGYPHYNPAPRWTALTLAVLIIVGGVWATMSAGSNAIDHAGERKRLIARREKLFGDLVRLENDYRAGRTDAQRRALRREDLVAALEQVYGALDVQTAAPQVTRGGIPAPMGATGAP